MNSSHAFALDAFQVLVPPPQNRLPRDGPYGWFYSLTLALLVAMAGMARRRGTWLIRLAVFPFATAAMLRFIYGFVGDDEPMNRAIATWGLQYCLKLIDFVLSPGPMLKLSEVHAENKDSSVQPTSSSVSTLLLSPLFFLYDAFELLLTFRGLDWQFGAEIGVRKPRHWSPTSSRLIFLLRSFYVIFRNTLICDIAQTIVQMAHLGGEQRESMFAFGGNNVVTKYASSTALHLVSGAIVLYGLELIFAVISAIAVLCGSSPASWPPLFDNPWASTSLHDLWGRRWHQLFRRSFLVGGGYPLAIVVDWATAIVKRRPTTTIHGVRAKTASLHPAAIAIGTCLASGLVHNWDYYGQRQGRTPGFTTIAFFAAQGFALALEREWRRVTGKTVGGFWGWLWVFFWMVIVAQPFLEDWHQLGFLDSLFVPPEHSPTRLFIIPFIHERFPVLFPPSLLDRL